MASYLGNFNLKGNFINEQRENEGLLRLIQYLQKAGTDQSVHMQTDLPLLITLFNKE